MHLRRNPVLQYRYNWQEARRFLLIGTDVGVAGVAAVADGREGSYPSDS